MYAEGVGRLSGQRYCRAGLPPRSWTGGSGKVERREAGGRAGATCSLGGREPVQQA